MKKTVLVIMLFLSTFTVLSAQDTIGTRIIKLAELKFKCERLGVIPHKYKLDTANQTTEKDSIFNLYSSQIHKIKQSSEIYLKYINKALKENDTSLRKERIWYRFPGIEPLYSLDDYLIKTIDLYRIVKYSLFKQDDNFLPENFQGLSMVDPKNYYGYYEPEPKFKKAVKFIIHNFSLSRQEKKFIRNRLNVRPVMEIKAYLDTTEVSLESKAFIEYALLNFIMDRRHSLSGLKLSYELSKDIKKSTPRDREP